MRELYQILQLPPGADSKAIKRAYHQAAHRTHPDKVTANADAEGLDAAARAEALQAATKAFREAVVAYEILRVDELRAAYDKLGMLGVYLARGELPRKVSDLGPTAERWARRLGHFAHVAKAAKTRWQGHRQKQEQAVVAARASAAGKVRGADTTATLVVDWATLVHGGPGEVAANDYVGCNACQATGYQLGLRPPDCPSCAGSGVLHLEVQGMVLRPRCPHCRGRGRAQAADCSVCRSLGAVPTARRWRLNLSPRHPVDSQLRRRNGGAPGPHDGPRGDLLVTVRHSATAATPASVTVTLQVPAVTSRPGSQGVTGEATTPSGRNASAMHVATDAATADRTEGGSAPASTAQSTPLAAPSNAAAADVYCHCQLSTAQATEGTVLTLATPAGTCAFTVPRGGAHDIARTVTLPGHGLWRHDGSRGALHVLLQPPLLTSCQTAGLSPQHTSQA